ncbi:PKD domain-containing protein [Segeticoccus rhizosphaerae]|uniref:PKD domain-containing protein n=1 Tax=Segeticoccus rhizosphaerae TaxID=1104777 RepID=UPI0012650E4F|nr:PKD domain-containing protein [Segeticoccus rhizosphaerae]
MWSGHEKGTIYTCYYALTDREGAGANVDGLMQAGTVDFWAAAPPEAPAPPDPRKLADRAVESMRLQAIGIGIVPEPKPGSMGLVGMPNWMWVQNASPNTWGPVTRTASTGPFSVTATAKVRNVVWDLGDGQRVTCGQGTPYRDMYGKKDSPTCGHTYTRQGDYTVRATSNWVIDWSGIGQSGTITMPLTRTATVHIGEAQVLVQ